MSSQPPTIGQVSDGGLFLRGRIAGCPARTGPGGRVESRCTNCKRQDYLAERDRGALLEPRGDIRIRQPVQAERGHYRPARKPGARWSGDEALGRASGVVTA